MKRFKLLALAVLLTAFYACDEKTQTEEKVEAEATEVVDVTKLNRENLKTEIKKREEALEKGDTPNHRNKYLLIEAYVAYADRFDNYESADEYLFKGARLASEVGMTAESIKYFDKLYNNFPEYKERPMALFMKAFVLENHANNLKEAKEHYELFLSTYPSHEMADDARISIENLGKSPEQIIREFEIRDSIKKAQEAS